MFVPSATVRRSSRDAAASAVNMALTVPQTVSIAAGAALVALVGYRWLVLAARIVQVVCAVSHVTRRRAPERLVDA